jgi:cupin fold WbuC family metalloprotein
MNFIQKSPEVLFASGPLARVQAEDIARLKAMASASPLRRARICAHMSVEDAIQEMLIVHARGVYVPPHRHHGKSESLHVIEGEGDVVFFDEAGQVTDVLRVGALGAGGLFYLRINACAYHCMVPRSDFFVFHETTSGPFRREDNEQAPWAPAETDAVGVAGFLHQTAAAIGARHKP